MWNGENSGRWWRTRKAQRTAAPGAAKLNMTATEQQRTLIGRQLEWGCVGGFQRPPVFPAPSSLLALLASLASLFFLVWLGASRSDLRTTAVFSQEAISNLGRGTRLSSCSVPTPYTDSSYPESCHHSTQFLDFLTYTWSGRAAHSRRGRDIYKVKSSKRFPHEKICRTVLSYIAGLNMCERKGSQGLTGHGGRNIILIKVNLDAPSEWLWMQWC